MFSEHRAHNETFVEYTARFLTVIQKYEADEGAKLAEKLKLQLLLRRGSLNTTQRDRMETWAGKDGDDLTVKIRSTT
jgi:hypothetical protein